MIFTRSENVPRFDDFRKYRDKFLRPDFQYRCAYCLIHERFFTEEGGGEIDHYRPLNPPPHVTDNFARLKNNYANLYWTCEFVIRSKLAIANLSQTDREQIAAVLEDDYLLNPPAFEELSLTPDAIKWYDQP